MTHTKEAQAIINRCYRNKQPVALKAIINEKYEIGNIHFKFTEELILELEQSDQVKVQRDGEKLINLYGVAGGIEK